MEQTMNKYRMLIFGSLLLSIGIVFGCYVIYYWQTSQRMDSETSWEKGTVTDQERAGDRDEQAKPRKNTRPIPEKLKTDFPLYDRLFTVAGEDVIETEADRQYPRREWLRMLMSKGIPIETYSHYSGWLSSRWGLVYAKADPLELASLKRTCDLPPDASWEEVVDAKIAAEWRMAQMLDAAQATDDSIFGGFLSKDGVFVPFRENTVYLQKTSPDSWVVTEGGVSQEVIVSIIQGEPPPNGIEVIYLDADGNPLRDADEKRQISDSVDITVLESNNDGAPSQAEVMPHSEQERDDEPRPSPPEENRPPKTPAPKPLTFDELPKSEADWERFLSESPLSELENRLSEDGLQSVAKTLTQYGVEEGLKRIEAKDPALAEQVRQRMTRNKRANQRRTTTPVKPVQAGHENGGKQ